MTPEEEIAEVEEELETAKKLIAELKGSIEEKDKEIEGLRKCMVQVNEKIWEALKNFCS